MKKGVLAGGAVLGAILSSACCWLPLLLVGLGASAGGVAAAFEAYRTPLLITTGVLLAAAFYFAYRPQRACTADGRCVEADPRLRRIGRAALWLSALVVLVFATFPSWSGMILADDVVAADAAAKVRQYEVRGMHCRACTGLLEAELMKIAGVASATVDYDHKTAVVSVRTGMTISDGDVMRAGESVGFTLAPSPRRVQPPERQNGEKMGNPTATR